MALSAVATTVALFVAYLAFYTGYSKTTKKLDPNQIIEVLFVLKGFDHTLVQLNKILALEGLTLLGVVGLQHAMPSLLQAIINPAGSPQLLWFATCMLWSHGVFSSLKYYSSAKYPAIQTWPSMVSEYFSSGRPMQRLKATRKASIIFAVCTQLFVSGWAFGRVSFVTITVLTALCLALMHFYTMEVNAQGTVGVRPFGRLAFIVPIAAVALLAARWLGLL